MEPVLDYISCRQAREWDMVVYLSGLGFEPARIKGNQFWYRSPLRAEHTPSFKVDRIRNRWYDFGIGKGGNILDFATLYFRCSIAEWLRSVNNGKPVYTPFLNQVLGLEDITASPLSIVSVQDLSHPALTQYLRSRSIWLATAGPYCRQVHYRIGAKNYFAIGFGNDSGGYELRNKYFKGSSSPKAITHHQFGHHVLTVFEGFFDFLSFLELCNGKPELHSDFLILNSLSFFDQAMALMQSYSKIHLYLDRNLPGRTCTTRAVAAVPGCLDKSSLYDGYEDLNDFLTATIEAGQHNAGLPDEKPP